MKKCIKMSVIIGVCLINTPYQVQAMKRLYHAYQAWSLYAATRDGLLANVHRIITKNPIFISAPIKKEYTALMVAACYGQEAVVDYLLTHGAAIDAKNAEGRTALMLAAQRELMHPIVQKLLDHHAQINLADATGKTALMLAAENGLMPTVHLLVAHGAQVTRRVHEKTAGDLAAQHNQPEIAAYLKTAEQLLAMKKTDEVAFVQGLIDRHDDLVHARNEHNQTALMLAAAQGNLPIVQYLVSKKSATHAQDDDLKTALMHAASVGALPVVTYLVTQGADLEIKDAKKNTALLHAAINRHWNVVRFLIERGARVIEHNDAQKTALSCAIRNCSDLAIIEQLLSHGADINAKDDEGWSPLLLASRTGNKLLINLLLTKQADINATREAGLTALMDATISGDTSTVELLIAHHSNLNAKTTESTKNVGSRWPAGMTALHFAIDRKNEKLAQLLLAHGADVNAANARGETPLMLAAASNQLALAHYLITDEHGQARMDLRDKHGACARDLAHAAGHDEIVGVYLDHVLFNAARAGDFARVKRLVEKQGATIDTCDEKGMTAAMIAESTGYPDIAEFLTTKMKKKSVEVASVTGHTALMIAAMQGHETLVTELIKRKAPLDACDQDGVTALMHAIAGGHKGIVTYLLEHSADVNKRDKMRESALTYAIRKGDLDSVHLLVSRGAHVTSRETNALLSPGIDKTPAWAEISTYLAAVAELHDACTREATDRIKAILQKYPDIINACNEKSQTAVMIAITNGLIDMTKTLLVAGANLRLCNNAKQSGADLIKQNSLLARALADFFNTLVQNDDKALVRKLIEQGVDLNQPASTGKTALMVAAHYGRCEILTWLLNKKVIVDTQDADGITALMLAAQNQDHALAHSCTECAKRLLALTGNSNLRNNAGATALMLASAAGNSELVHALIAKGADVSLTDMHGQTALMYAAQSGTGDIAHCLLTAHARIDARDTQKRTALMHAALQGNVESARCLIIEGCASLRDRNNTGKTALELAQRANQQGIILCFNTLLHEAIARQDLGLVRQLLRQGADMFACDERGATALAKASTPENEAIMNFLLVNGGSKVIHAHRGET